MQQITGTRQELARPQDDGRVIEDITRVLGILVRGWRFIVLAVAICLALAAAYAVRAQTSYQATAQLLVVQKGARPLGAGIGDPLHQPTSGDSLAAHLMIIRSPAVVARALEAARLRNISVRSAIPALTAKQPVEAANVIELTYRAETSDAALAVLTAVVESYRKFLSDNYQQNAGEVIAYIEKARVELSTELAELERKYLEFQRANPDFTTADGRPLAAQRLEQWAQAANQAMGRAMQLKTQLELGQRLSGEGAGLEAITNALNQLAGVAGGEPISLQSPAAGSPGPRGTALEQVLAELASVEHRRRLAELQLANLRQRAAAPARSADETQVARLFYADPEVAALQEDLAQARAYQDEAMRRARNPSDPARRRHAEAVQELQQQLDSLWKERRPHLVESLQGGVEAIRETEASLGDLEALEQALRTRAGELRAEQVAALRQERDRVAAQHGAGDKRISALDGRISALEGAQVGSAGPADSAGPGSAQSLVESLALSLKAIEAMQGELQEHMSRDLATSRAAEVRLLEGENLRKNLERQQALFDSVTTQLKQAQLGSDYESVSAQLIAPPSVAPTRPQLTFILALAVFAGCALGGGAAFVADLLDPRVRTPNEVRAIFDAPLLAVLPQLPRDQLLGPGELAMLCHRAPRSFLAEAFRSARTSIEFLRRTRDIQVLLVSSAVPGDGKTTSVSNLAISLAHAGRRVLLIDGDLRKPSLHAIYGLDPNRGLTLALRDGLSVAEVIQPTTVANLDLITAGPHVSNPAELLASERFGTIVAELRTRFDVILIDSSPLLVVTDPSIISAVADALLLVVRIEDARRQDAERTIDLLRTLGTPVLGAVINGVSRRQLGYGYGQPYGTAADRTLPAIDTFPVGGLDAMTVPQAFQPGDGVT
jgi:capsular exopolysaccharide synthesis family protein